MDTTLELIEQGKKIAVLEYQVQELRTKNEEWGKFLNSSLTELQSMIESLARDPVGRCKI